MSEQLVQLPDEQKIKAMSAHILQKTELPEMQCIVKNMLYEGLAILAGPPKIGKSWCSLQLGLSVSQGDNFLGFETNQGTVLYLALEDSYKRLQSRLNIMLDGKEAPKSFLFAIRCNSLATGLLSQLQAFLLENPAIKLIIIDTLQLVRGQAEKNETFYGNDYKELNTIKQFADENHICIVLIHHFRKMADISDTFNQISGTTGITGAADTMITLSKEKRFEDKTILSLTGRDIEGGEFLLKSDKKTRRWELISSMEELEVMNQRTMYQNNPIVITINELLDKNPEGLKISSKDLYNEIIYRRKRKPNQGSPGALTRAIGALALQMAEHDGIHYEAPNPNGGANGRKLYFCRAREKSNR